MLKALPTSHSTTEGDHVVVGTPTGSLFLEEGAGSGRGVGRRRPGDAPPGVMARFKQVGLGLPAHERGPALAVLVWTLFTRHPSTPPLLLLPPPHKRTHSGIGSKDSDNQHFFFWLQFSSGRRQKTPHSIPPLTQPAPNHPQPQHETAKTQRQLPRASRAHICAGPSFADLIIRGFINISAGRGEWKGNGGAHNRVFVSTVHACASPTNRPGWDCAGSLTGLIFLIAHNDN